MDEMAHHRRRYRLPELQAKLRAAGFEIRALTHFMAPLVPLLFLARAAGRGLEWFGVKAAARRSAELRINPGLNGLLALVLRVERRLLAWGLRPPFGSSLLAVASRPEGSRP
jgi:hypothetical protein